MGIKRKVYLTFPAKQVTESVICDMYDKFQVRFNIRSATVNDHQGLMAMELEHDNVDNIKQAMEYFKSRGLKVEPIEMDVISG